MTQQAKDWCFTYHFHDTESAREAIKKAIDTLRTKDCIVYFVLQGEKTVEGRPHLQGFIQCRSRRTLKDVLKILADFPGVHLEKRRGSPREASDYCKADVEPAMKNGKPNPKAGEQKHFPEVYERVEHGELQRADDKPGKRTDVERLWSAIYGDEKTEAEMFQDHPETIKFHSGVRAAIAKRDLGTRHLRKQMKIIWIWGDSGTGKDNLRRKMFPELGPQYLRTSEKANNFWRDYTGEKVVCYIDFNPDAWDDRLNNELLMIGDREAYNTNIKNGSGYLQAEVIIFTSRWHWSDCFIGHDQQKDWRRRIKDYCEYEYMFTGLGRCKKIKNNQFKEALEEIPDAIIEEEISMDFEIKGASPPAPP